LFSKLFKDPRGQKINIGTTFGLIDLAFTKKIIAYAKGLNFLSQLIKLRILFFLSERVKRTRRRLLSSQYILRGKAIRSDRSTNLNWFIDMKTLFVTHLKDRLKNAFKQQAVELERY